MKISYLRTFTQHVHALEKSGRLSDDDTRQLEKHMKLLCHFFDVQNVKKAEKQAEMLASIMLAILGR